MKAAATIFLLAIAAGYIFACSSVRAMEIDADGRIVLSPEEKAVCQRQGGAPWSPKLLCKRWPASVRSPRASRRRPTAGDARLPKKEEV